MKINNATDEDLSLIKNLYKEAFPIIERVPFRYLKRKSSNKKIEILSIKKEQRFVGFLITTMYNNIVLICYFAICESERGKGIGSEALKLIRDKYNNKTIILEIESIEDRAKNLSERIKRKQFYLKNGFKESKIKSRIIFQSLEILYNGEMINEYDYKCALKKSFGRVYEIITKIYIK